MEGLTSFGQLLCGIQINSVQDSGIISRTRQDAFPQVKKHAGERWPPAVKSGNRRVAESSGPSSEGSLWADLKGLI